MQFLCAIFKFLLKVEAPEINFQLIVILPRGGSQINKRAHFRSSAFLIKHFKLDLVVMSLVIPPHRTLMNSSHYHFYL
jgi:hypothetical protein